MYICQFTTRAPSVLKQKPAGLKQKPAGFKRNRQGQ
jgi:hypothetical protein